jgi:hypothetical protein
VGDDQTFKEFLREFLREFLQLFFPEVESRLDFRELQFLETESFTSFPEGSSRTADVVAEVRTRDGDRELLLIHVEVEARRKRAFSKRMFQYFVLLWTKYRVPIFPVAIYLRGGRAPRIEEVFPMKVLGREQLRFQFPAVALARLEAKEYVEKGGAVGAALASLMSRRGAPGRVELQLLMRERVALSALNDARKVLLLNLIETYFVLTTAERKKMERKLSKKRYREVKKMQLTWLEKVESKGRREGVLEGKQDALLRQLTAKFGPVPARTVSRVRAIHSLKELDRYLDRVLEARSFAEIGLGNSRARTQRAR